MIALEKAIIAKWQESTAITASGPWLDIPEDKATYPFGVFSYIGNGRTNQFFGGQQDEEIVFRFTIFHAGDPSSAQSNLHARFDNVKLDLTGHGGGTNYHFVREGQSSRYEGVDKDGAKVYRADSIYRTKTSL